MNRPHAISEGLFAVAQENIVDARDRLSNITTSWRSNKLKKTRI